MNRRHPMIILALGPDSPEAVRAMVLKGLGPDDARAVEWVIIGRDTVDDTIIQLLEHPEMAIRQAAVLAFEQRRARESDDPDKWSSAWTSAFVEISPSTLPSTSEYWLEKALNRLAVEDPNLVVAWLRNQLRLAEEREGSLVLHPGAEEAVSHLPTERLQEIRNEFEGSRALLFLPLISKARGSSDD